MIVDRLRRLGLNEKEISVYLALVSTGAKSVAAIAQKAGINRGTAYDVLKSLTNKGLASMYKSSAEASKKQRFAAEPPEKIMHLLETRAKDLENLKDSFQESLPELKALYEKSGAKPVAKYYEGFSGIRLILQDILACTAQIPQKEYYAYSAAEVRSSFYKVYPNFNKDRIKAKIKVKVIALGKGGEFAGLDERKWMAKDHGAPAYILIYAGKVAMISLDNSNQPVGVVIEDDALYQTQKMIFDFNWSKL